MNKDAILEFLKKNIMSLSCGVVALLCIVAIFYPLGGMTDQLNTEVTERAGAYSTLQQSLNKEFKLPVVDIDKADPGKLPNFPNGLDVKAGEAAKQQFADYSKQTETRIVQLNQAAHPLMLPGEKTLNKITEEDNYIFPRLYLLILGTDPAITGQENAKTTANSNPNNHLLWQNKDLNLQNDILHGGAPPTEQDFHAAEIGLWNSKYTQQIITDNGQDVNRPEVEGRWRVEAAKLPPLLKKEAARKYRVYVDPDAFQIDQKIDPKVAPEPDTRWYCQLQVWVDQDIARAIASANENSSSVLEAPVKRLLSVQLNSPPATYLQAPSATGTPGAAPAAPGPGSDTAPITANYLLSPTGRYCNGMYDVVPFVLTIDVDAARVNDVLETISRGTLMTVQSENAWAVNLPDEFANGYLYGSSPVIRLELHCESIFFRDWTVPLMPDKVKMDLGLLSPTPGVTGGGMGSQQPGPQPYPGSYPHPFPPGMGH